VTRIAVVDRNPEISQSGLQGRFPEIEIKPFEAQPDRRRRGHGKVDEAKSSRCSTADD